MDVGGNLFVSQCTVVRYVHQLPCAGPLFHLPVRRNLDLFRFPRNSKEGDFRQGPYHFHQLRSPRDRRLPWRHNAGVIGPVGDNPLEVFVRSRKSCPLLINAPERGCLRVQIHLGLLSAPQRHESSSWCYLQWRTRALQRAPAVRSIAVRDFTDPLPG